MKKETVLIGGHETDADIAREIFNLIRSSVQRVVEALVIAGKTDEQVKAAAKTTTEAVVESMIDLVRSKAKAADPVSSSSPANPSKPVDSPVPEVR